MTAEATEVTRTVHVQRIRRDWKYQVRRKLDAAQVDKLAGVYLSGRPVQPIKVALVKGSMVPILIDGWHRVAALEKIGRDTTTAEVIETTEREATWLAAAANLEHGLPLKSGELRSVFRSYVRARKHITSKGKFKSYRDIAPEIGKPANTIHRWMHEDFPQVAAKMGGDENFKGKGGLAELPARPLPSVANTQAALQVALENFKAVQCPRARGDLIALAERVAEEMKKAGEWEAQDF